MRQGLALLSVFAFLTQSAAQTVTETRTPAAPVVTEYRTPAEAPWLAVAECRGTQTAAWVPPGGVRQQAAPGFRADPKLLAASVEIRQGGRGGSGVIVHRDGERAYVLTCRHLVQGPGAEISVRVGGRSWFPGSWLWSDRQFDVSVLSIPARPVFWWAPLADREPSLGETVVQIGFPAGWDGPF